MNVKTIALTAPCCMAGAIGHTVAVIDGDINQSPKAVLEEKEEGRATETKPASQRTKKPKRKVEELIVQYPLKLRASLRDELAQKAALAGMTMRRFIMSALKEQGIDVTEDDMVDRRKGK
jgi:hypothetical protein